MALNLDKVEKLPLPQKAAIVGLIIILIYVVFYVVYVTDKKKEIGKLEEDLTKLNYEVSQGKAVLAKIEEYEKKKVELEKQLKEAEKRLPRESKIPELLETLSDLARGNNLLFPSFVPSKAAKGGGGLYQEIPIDAEFSGNYNDIAMFFDQVSKLERIVNVGSLSLTPQEKKKSGGASAKTEEEGPQLFNIMAKVQIITYMFAGGQ